MEIRVRVVATHFILGAFETLRVCHEPHMPKLAVAFCDHIFTHVPFFLVAQPLVF